MLQKYGTSTALLYNLIYHLYLQPPPSYHLDQNVYATDLVYSTFCYDGVIYGTCAMEWCSIERYPCVCGGYFRGVRERCHCSTHGDEFEHYQYRALDASNQGHWL